MAAFIVLGKYLWVLNTISLEIDQNFDLFMMWFTAVSLRIPWTPFKQVSGLGRTKTWAEAVPKWMEYCLIEQVTTVQWQSWLFKGVGEPNFPARLEQIPVEEHPSGVSF